MSKKSLALSIVIPAWQEARRLPGSLERIAACLAAAPFSSEVLVVVEKSADGTLELAREFAARHPLFRVLGQPAQRGKGHAVRTGMLAAEGGICLFMDADLSVPLASVGVFYETLQNDPAAAILVGNRQHPASQIVQAQGWLRRKMGQAFNGGVRRLAGLALRDTQCGFKAFRRDVARDLFARQRIDGFAFDVEILLLAQRLGYTVRDLPVEWSNSSDSKVHILRDSAQMLRDIWRIRQAVAKLPERAACAGWNC